MWDDLVSLLKMRDHFRSGKGAGGQYALESQLQLVCGLTKKQHKTSDFTSLICYPSKRKELQHSYFCTWGKRKLIIDY